MYIFEHWLIFEELVVNGDAGVGLEMLKHMRNSSMTDTVLLATRHCKPGFKHIGNKRFNIIKDLCSAAVAKINN